MHLKDPLVFFGFEASALTSFPRFLLSHALSLFFNNLAKDYFFMALNGPMCRCACKPLFIHSFIPIALANIFPLSLEQVILRRCEVHLTTSENQFCFKHKH